MRQKKHKNYKNMMKITALLLAVGLCTGCAAESRTDTKDTDQKAAVTEYSASEESQAAGASATQKSAEDLPQSSRDIFAMDTVMSVTAYGEDAETAVSAAVDEINRLDTLFSVGNAESDIARLNTEKTATVSDETFSLVERSLDLYKSTEGALNITIYPLMEAWALLQGITVCRNRQNLHLFCRRCRSMASSVTAVQRRSHCQSRHRLIWGQSQRVIRHHG